jgi:hypothetical protein
MRAAKSTQMNLKFSASIPQPDPKRPQLLAPVKEQQKDNRDGHAGENAPRAVTIVHLPPPMALRCDRPRAPVADASKRFRFITASPARSALTVPLARPASDTPRRLEIVAEAAQLAAERETAPARDRDRDARGDARREAVHGFNRQQDRRNDRALSLLK